MINKIRMFIAIRLWRIGCMLEQWGTKVEEFGVRMRRRNS